jgi:ABC-type antimicrobial peptide transport system ATPase subunit
MINGIVRVEPGLIRNSAAKAERRTLPTHIRLAQRQSMRRSSQLFNSCRTAGVAHVTARRVLPLGRLVEHGDTETLFLNPIDLLTQRYMTGRFG